MSTPSRAMEETAKEMVGRLMLELDPQVRPLLEAEVQALQAVRAQHESDMDRLTAAVMERQQRWGQAWENAFRLAQETQQEGRPA